MLSALLLGFLLQAPNCQEGAEWFRKGDLVRAKQATAAALAAQSSAYCEKVMGVLYAAEGEHRKAEVHFQAACRKDPREIDACYFWARALYSLDRFEASLAALAMVPAGATLEWKLAAARGQALDALGRPEAERELQRGIEERKKDKRPAGEVDPLLALASFYYRQGRAGEALALLQGADSSYQRLAPFQYQLGRAWLAEGKLEAAAEALQRAVALQPVYAEAHGLLSRAYFRLGQNELGKRHQDLARQGSVTVR